MLIYLTLQNVLLSVQIVYLVLFISVGSFPWLNDLFYAQVSKKAINPGFASYFEGPECTVT